MKKTPKTIIEDTTNKVKFFLLHRLWTIDTSSLPKYQKIAISLVRTFALAFRGFKEDKVNLRASSLTFFSVLSVVPILALAFGFAKGFGLDGRLQSILKENLKGQEEVADWIFSFANNMLSSVNGGWIIGVGLVFLIWTVMKVLGNIENSFNEIWQVKKSRMFFRKFSDYLAIMLFAPILLVLSSSTQVFLIEMMDKITKEIAFVGYVGPALYMAVKFIPFILIWLLFTLIYLFMPNTKVKFSSALIAGIVAGAAFQLLQWGYFHFQIGVSRYNTIYGSFAALPLFLVWLNWSWLIVLFGAEISFSAQNQEQYQFESDIKNLSNINKQLIFVLITHFVIDRFQKNELPPTSKEISTELKLPIRLVNLLIYELIECRIIAETPSNLDKESGFLPSVDIHKLKIFDIIYKTRSKGSTLKDKEENSIIQNIEEKFETFYELTSKSDVNILVKDLAQ